MADESTTVRITRDELRGLGYYDDAGIVVEEQQSDNEEIAKLLSEASKAETGQPGMPEFIIWKKGVDTVVIIECKASAEDHASRNYGQPRRYAVDGVLHYAKSLKDGYNVVAIAVSGVNKDAMKTSVFLWDKRGSTYEKSPQYEIEKFDRYVEQFRPHRPSRMGEDDLPEVRLIKSVTGPSRDGMASQYVYKPNGKLDYHATVKSDSKEMKVEYFKPGEEKLDDDDR